MSVEDEKLSALICMFDDEENEDLLNSDDNTKKNSSMNCNSEITNKKEITVFNNNELTQSLILNPKLINNNYKEFDKFFGIKVSNPKISFELMNEHCGNMEKIQLSSISKNNIKSDEWMTMAIIVNKTNCRKSLNGKEYIMWQVSDFKSQQNFSLKVFLFGDCFKENWKLQKGMVVLLINPSLDNNSSQEIILKLFKNSQVECIGFCPDYGTCKALKADGTRCTLFVNLSVTEYCVYHIQNAARKFSAKRGVFSSTSNVPPKSWRLKEPKNESISNLTTVNRLCNQKFVKSMPLHSKLAKNLKNSSNNSSSQLSNTTNNLLDNASNCSNKLKRKISCNALATPTQNQCKRVKSMKEFIDSQQKQPQLGSRAQSGFVDLISPEKKIKKRNQLEEAKIKKAAEILRNSNLNKKNNTKHCLSNNSLKIGEKENSNSSGRKVFSNEEIALLLNKKSKNESEVLMNYQEVQERYFTKQEAQEKLETYVTTLTEIKNCKVVTCKACNYTATHQSEFCKSLGHIVQRHSADKRFFKCKVCNTRTTSFKIMPTKPCQSCLAVNYVRVTMRDERKIEQEKLFIRGEERKFVNT